MGSCSTVFWAVTGAKEALQSQTFGKGIDLQSESGCITVRGRAESRESVVGRLVEGANGVACFRSAVLPSCPKHAAIAYRSSPPRQHDPTVSPTPAPHTPRTLALCDQQANHLLCRGSSLVQRKELLIGRDSDRGRTMQSSSPVQPSGGRRERACCTKGETAPSSRRKKQVAHS